MFPFGLGRETEIGQGVSEFRSAGYGSGPPGRHFVKGMLKSQDGAQSGADPSRDAHGLGSFFHERGACFIQRLRPGHAVAKACERRLLQAGAEECCKEERERRGCAASTEPIEPFKVRVK
jgi:hypothetical protein